MAEKNKSQEDIVNKYPKPPFEKQKQPWPGIAKDMKPAPDHGEKSYRGSGRMKGSKVLITGGDSGIGRAAAIAFAREGADVAINYYPTEEEDAKEVIELMKVEGVKAVALPGDLMQEAFCRQLIQQAVDQLGGLDVLVSNAARQQVCESVTELASEDFDATIKTNIYAPFWLIREAVPHMKPGSSIIATTSTQAYEPSANLFDYALTKAATMNMVKSLALQLGEKGIRVNGVAPGPVWTPLQVSGGATQEKIQQFGGDSALGRPGQPAELAGMFIELASNESSFTTGNIHGAGGGKGQP